MLNSERIQINHCLNDTHVVDKHDRSMNNHEKTTAEIPHPPNNSECASLVAH